MLHARYLHPDARAAIGELAGAVGFTQVSLSSEVSPLMRLVPRGDTTVVDAYLSPILRRYVEQVAAELRRRPADVHAVQRRPRRGRHFRGKDAILSGPAGGIVGMARTSQLAGFDRVIGFDMGGTSTDVSHYAGEFERAFETQVAGVRMRAPDDGHPHRRRRAAARSCTSTAAATASGPTPPAPIPGPPATGAAAR